MSAHGGRVYRILADDHDRLDELLTRARSSQTGHFDLDAYEQFRAGILRHIAIEERVLFSFVKKRLGSPLEGVPLLRAEHSAIAKLLCFRPDRSLLDEIEKILKPHNEREEGPDGIYARCEEVAGDDVERLADEIAAFGEVTPAPYRDPEGGRRTAEETLAWALRGKGL